jgi:uncharacterized protein (TIGR02646 family)
MIRLNRNKYDEHGALIHPGAAWSKRSRTARDEVIQQQGARHFRDDVYAAPQVKACLREISSGKCAYCEYPLTRTDLNVEHYRPKARVYERDDHPGYYWLAYEWDNLLPACQHCNQLRSDPPILGNLGRTRARGKGDKFPLADEQFRAFSPADQMSKEEPLLINPALEDPSEHITFDPLGKPIGRTEKGITSIEVYNLDTMLLNRARRETIRRMARLCKLSRMGEAQPEDQGLQQELVAVESLIRDSTADSAYYAAAARAVYNNPRLFELP